MHRYLRCIYLALFMLFSCNLAAESEIKEVSLEILQGEWLHKNYAETLRKSKSLSEAVRGIYRTAFIITENGSVYKWLILYNFHEGLAYELTGLEPASEPSTYHLLFHKKQFSWRETENDRFLIAGTEPNVEIVDLQSHK